MNLNVSKVIAPWPLNYFSKTHQGLDFLKIDKFFTKSRLENYKKNSNKFVSNVRPLDETVIQCTLLKIIRYETKIQRVCKFHS